MKRFQIFLMILTAAVTCHSQDHFPLQVGNRWDYGYIDFVPGEPSHFVYQWTLKVLSDTILPNGKEYFELSGGGFLREEGDTVFSYSPYQGEHVAIDFSRPDGDTTYEYFTSDTQVTVVHVGSATLYGATRTVWGFETYSLHSSGYSFIQYIDGIGRGYWESEGGYNEYLIGAIVNGIQYGTVMDVQPPSQETPAQFSLSQNYPNPFNPTTTIKYTVEGIRSQASGVSEVRIVIYDMLGREVVTLVNAPQLPGTYEVKFDGARLASGVYFYRLTAGSYSATRAMLLER